ncbi:Nucleoside-diphosphate-sugar epimerase [Gammaproteobacteria bacterium]
MSLILLTGAYGFVGTNLSTHLARMGHELWALDLKSQWELADTLAHSKRGAYVRHFDWEEFSAIPWDAIDAVIHLASKAHDTRNVSNARSYFDINVGLTRRVVDRLLEVKRKEGRKLIVFSSVKAVADHVEGVLTEDAELSPRTPYGQSKLEAERYVRDRLGDDTSVEPYVLRPCMIHGPGNKGNLNLLYTVVRRGIPWPLGSFDNQRSFTSIANLMAVIERLLAGNVVPGTYQIADDEALSTNEIIKIMAEVLGQQQARIWQISPRLMRGVARVGDTLYLPLNSERLEKLTESYVVSNDRIKRALGWEHMPIQARDGLKATLESFATKIVASSESPA